MPKDNLAGEFILKRDALPPVSSGLETDITDSKKPAVKNFSSFGEHGKKPHFFSSFCRYPKGLTFENQEPDEQILLLIRQAFITNVPWITLVIIVIFIPPFIPSLLSVFFPFLSFSDAIITALILFSYLLIAGFALLRFILWYFHAALLTTKRLIDVDVEGLLYKNVAETKIELIQDVSYTQIGSIRSLFNYGDIFVQTAGAMPNFEFVRAPKPAEIIRIIGDLIGK